MFRTSRQADGAPDSDISPDAVLARWLSEPDGDAARQLLATLSGFIERRVRPIVEAKIGWRSGSRTDGADDVDDVCQSVHCRLLEHLIQLKGTKDRAPIQNFATYVAAVARRECDDLSRSTNHRWVRLRNRMRYVVRRAPGFATWTGRSKEEIWGLAGDRGREPTPNAERLQQARVEFASRLDPREAPLPDLMTAIFGAGGPLTSNHAVEVAAEWQAIAQPAAQSVQQLTATGATILDTLPDSGGNAEQLSMTSECMRSLWLEIGLLSIEHRRAVLLNLRDTMGGRIDLFVLLGIASIGQIAEVLQWDPLTFAALWPKLPIPDAEIARLLGTTPRDVSNRRSTARQRLRRRLRHSCPGV